MISIKVGNEITTYHLFAYLFGHKSKLGIAHYLGLNCYIKWIFGTQNNWKIMGAILELPAKQHCQLSPFTKNGQNGLNWQCCLAGSSKMAPSILICWAAMGAKPSFYMKFWPLNSENSSDVLTIPEISPHWEELLKSVSNLNYAKHYYRCKPEGPSGVKRFGRLWKIWKYTFPGQPSTKKHF